MNNSDIQKIDFFMCAAFKQILTSPKDELEQKLGRNAHIAIAKYLQSLPLNDLHNPAIMKNHIAIYCQQKGNETLHQWWGEVYRGLHKDGIDKLVKKSLDPSEEADDEPETQRVITNEGRDICKYLEDWAKDTLNQENQGNKDDYNSQ